MSEIMNPVVPQRDVTDRPPVAPDMGSGVPEGTAGLGAITPPAAAPPIPAGTQINKDPNAIPGTVEPHHGMLATIFQDLAGGKKTTYRQTENGPVAVKENLKPGEMAQKEKQENEKKENAEKQFQNQNVADEMTLRKAANARDQQRSLDLAQEHILHMEQGRQQLEQGKFEFAQRTTEFEQKQADRINLLRTLGAKPLTYPDGKPVQ